MAQRQPPTDVREMLPDRAVERLTARFRQGDAVAEAEAVDWQAFGNGRVEFEHADGRVVTGARDELEEVRY